MRHLIGLVAGVLILNTTAFAATPQWVATPYGAGPLKIGMSVPEAEAALGAKLDLDRDVTNDFEACTTAPVPGQTGVSLLFENLRLARISVTNASVIKTDRGIAGGSTEADVRRLYKPLSEATAAYSEPPALDLTFWAVKDKAGILFQTDTTRKVVELRIGTKAIAYIEGCL